MQKILFALTSLAIAPAAAAAPADTTVPIRQFLDGLNKGDTASAYAAYDSGPIAIIDEFPPHSWIGPKAAQNWAADYETTSKAAGVTDGIVTYGKPTRSEIEGDVAYVIIPTGLTYKQAGKPTAEEGQMTFALHATTAGWKIRAWTWTGGAPHPAK